MDNKELEVVSEDLKTLIELEKNSVEVKDKETEESLIFEKELLSKIEGLEKEQIELKNTISKLHSEKMEKDSEFYEKVLPYLERNTDARTLESQNEYLEKLVLNTEPKKYEKELDTVTYYGSMSIFLFVMAVVPVYISYRMIKGVFGLTRHIL